MTLLVSCRSLTKAFSARPLFTGISLGVSDGERMGLIGPNGSGKSTLLKILAGIEPADSGDITARRGLRIAFMSQDDEFPADATINSVMSEAIADMRLEDYERVSRIGIALARVGFEGEDRAVNALSGGWRKRLSLARALVQDPELMLLDEPTNHLDLEGVLWLEQFLKSANFACIVVSHDRYFLENVANRVVELNRSYPEGFLKVEGAYSDFLTARADFLEAQAHQEAALQFQVNREIEWLRRGPQARATKAQFRIQAAGKMIDELAELKYRNSRDRAAEIDFTSTDRKSKELLVARDVAKSMGGRRLFSNLSFVLSPGVRLGLLGANGSGKTTLLNLLTGALEPDSGIVKRADGLRVVWFDQNRERLERGVTLKEALSPAGETVVYKGRTMHIAGWARRFLFESEQLDQPVDRLSGGEQARVLIARLMLQPADVLILDEPTNDLDIPTLEVLEASLAEFDGAVVLVTHDRYMLDNVSTELLALNGDGETTFYADYAQWQSAKDAAARTAAVPAAKGTPAPRKPAAVANAPRRLSTAEQKELRAIEDVINVAEGRVEAAQTLLADPQVASDHLKMAAAWKALQDAQAEVNRHYARWEALEARL